MLLLTEVLRFTYFNRPSSESSHSQNDSRSVFPGSRFPSGSVFLGSRVPSGSVFLGSRVPSGSVFLGSRVPSRSVFLGPRVVPCGSVFLGSRIPQWISLGSPLRYPVDQCSCSLGSPVRYPVDQCSWIRVLPTLTQHTHTVLCMPVCIRKECINL